jgi:hypothetical protein
MLFALAIPALAYETDGSFNNVTPAFNPGPPEDIWTFTRVFHWVVRGETLDEIAKFYGTVPEAIIDNNKNYFNDLALRNKTLYGDKEIAKMTLENGVRLFIYDLLTVKHYVVRGDTLNNLSGQYKAAGGTLALYDDFGKEIFRIKTTVAAIKNENAAWFRNLDLLSITEGRNISLTESNNIFAYYSGLLINGVRSNWDAWDVNGSPLYISVPVEVSYINGLENPNATAKLWAERIRLDPFDSTQPNEVFVNAIAYKANSSEDKFKEGAWTDYGYPLIPEQKIYGNTTPPENTCWDYNVGWTYNFTNKMGYYISNTTLLPATAEYVYGTSPLKIYWGKLGINKIRNLKMDRVVGDDEYVYGSNSALLGAFGEYMPWQKYISLK